MAGFSIGPLTGARVSRVAVALIVLGAAVLATEWFMNQATGFAKGVMK